MIRRLLIANRGEIACRIMRAAARLGVETVAVYSDADADALHVQRADQAVRIGPAAARDSYLRGDAILAAARDTGADAIHPGYGFLSENAEFADAVLGAGLIWVGPDPASIRAMGLKDAAKALMAAAGVPVTPGYQGDDQSPARLAAEADAIGYPVLIKAVAGGGGKGMRRVDRANDFADALAGCQREAAAAFGNDIVLIEKYIAQPRHIEVQVFGDRHGSVVHLFERDCSLQRRHQKVIEEAPAPGMDEATRAAVCAAAVKAARAVDYVGAGTIEFIADASGPLGADRIWFMEMNTRLQVEHPVTEAITGVDLVEWQLRVAAGAPLPLTQDALRIDGHAVEARLYAEDPATGFLPSVGPLDRLSFPDGDVRVDTGVVEGGAVSPHYDPMIAKLIVHRPTRGEAIAALADACAAVEVWPVRTNAAFLARLLREPAFADGDVSTAFIAERGDALTALPTLDAGRASAALATLAPAPPRLRGFRMGAPAVEAASVWIDGAAQIVPIADRGPVLFRDRGDAIVFADGAPHRVSLRPPAGGQTNAANGAIIAPMPGRITSMAVIDGARVAAGDRLLTMEAMKMEHALTAPFDGTVTGLTLAVGAQVVEGTILLTVAPDSD